MTDLGLFLHATSDGYVGVTSGGAVVGWNDQIEELLGVEIAQSPGLTLADLLGVPIADVGRLLEEAVQGRGRLEVAVTRADGTELELSLVAWAAPTNGSAATAEASTDVHVLVQDISAHRRAERQLRSARQELAREATELWHRAFHDPLTSLANRNLLHDRADHALSRRGEGTVAVMLVDLDGFKAINDALGHAVGDELLIQVAERLKGCVRPSDTVSRPGGDEFALLLEEVAGPEEAAAAAQRVLDELAAPFTVDQRSLVMSASVGIAMSRRGEQTVAELLGNADVALYRAKDDGRGCFSVFDPSMQAAALARLEMEADLRHALVRGELEVHYQPIGMLRGGRIAGVEALVRWSHPTRGMVSPADFIPLAEDTGLIVRLGEWVLGEACRQAAAWHRHFPRSEPVSVAVNVSGKQIIQPGFVQAVERILLDTKLDPKYLVLEITESLLTEDAGVTLVNLRGLRDLGARLSIDDFGTGYSSLARLRAFPVDELKIDRSFIHALDASTDDEPLVAAVIAMAHSLGLDVVGEGVETEHQLEVLREHGCDRVQGFLLGRPSPAAAVGAVLGEPAKVLQMAAAHAVLGDSVPIASAEVTEALAAALTAGGEVEDMAKPLLTSVARLTGLESVYLTRIHWDRSEQEIIAAYNAGPLEVPTGVVMPWEAAEGVYNDSRLVSDLGFETYVSVPLVASGGGRHGTLSGVARGEVRLRKDHLAVMELFGRVLADEIRSRTLELREAPALITD